MKITAKKTENPVNEFNETTDLKKEEEQITELANNISQLIEDIQQRHNNLKLNLNRLKEQRDERLSELRKQYDSCIGKGDSVGADKVLKEIRNVHKQLESLARNVVDSESDFSDLLSRKDELHLKAGQLYKIRLANFELARKLMVQVTRLFPQVSSIAGSLLRDVEKVAESNKKIARQILSE